MDSGVQLGLPLQSQAEVALGGDRGIADGVSPGADVLVVSSDDHLAASQDVAVGGSMVEDAVAHWWHMLSQSEPSIFLECTHAFHNLPTLVDHHAMRHWSLNTHSCIDFKIMQAVTGLLKAKHGVDVGMELSVVSAPGPSHRQHAAEEFGPALLVGSTVDLGSNMAENLLGGSSRAIVPECEIMVFSFRAGKVANVDLPLSGGAVQQAYGVVGEGIRAIDAVIKWHLPQIVIVECAHDLKRSARAASDTQLSDSDYLNRFMQTQGYWYTDRLVNHTAYGGSFDQVRWFSIFVRAVPQAKHDEATHFFDRVHNGMRGERGDLKTFLFLGTGELEECVENAQLTTNDAAPMPSRVVNPKVEAEWKAGHLKVCNNNGLIWPFVGNDLVGLTPREQELVLILDKLWPAPARSDFIHFIDVTQKLSGILTGRVSELTGAILPDYSPWKSEPVFGKCVMRYVCGGSKGMRVLHPVEEMKLIGWSEDEYLGQTISLQGSVSRHSFEKLDALTEIAQHSV